VATFVASLGQLLYFFLASREEDPRRGHAPALRRPVRGCR
jgi:hypothetical protein